MSDEKKSKDGNQQLAVVLKELGLGLLPAGYHETAETLGSVIWDKLKGWFYCSRRESIFFSCLKKKHG